jgi:hypothetical protein
VFTEPLLSNGRLLSCDWPAPEMWAVPTSFLASGCLHFHIVRIRRANGRNLGTC